MEISIATGSHVSFHLTSPHKEIHDGPHGTRLEEGTKSFWQPMVDISGSTNTETNTNTQKYKTKSYPTLNHQSSRRLPDKYPKLS